MNVISRHFDNSDMHNSSKIAVFKILILQNLKFASPVKFCFENNPLYSTTVDELGIFGIIIATSLVVLPIFADY